jgi:hypothetical protein
MLYPLSYEGGTRVRLASIPAKWPTAYVPRDLFKFRARVRLVRARERLLRRGG